VDDREFESLICEERARGGRMSTTRLKTGHWVSNPRCPEWGIGEVIGIEPDAVRVAFETSEKKICTRVVELEIVAPPTKRDHS